MDKVLFPATRRAATALVCGTIVFLFLFLWLLDATDVRSDFSFASLYSAATNLAIAPCMLVLLDSKHNIRNFGMLVLFLNLVVSWILYFM